jgi:Fic family protein
MFMMNIYEKIDLYQTVLNELRPYEGDLLRQIRDYYRISLTWSSNALEGNTLTENETKILIEDGLTAGGKPLSDSFEVIGHAKAYDYMFTLLNNSKITEDDILMLHKLFYYNIDENNAGRYRNQPVIITGSKYPVAKVEKIQSEMYEFLKWIHDQRQNYHPVEFAAQLHKRFVFIHPFIDGNGRIARLLMNVALIQNGYMLAVIPPVLRHEYVSLLERAHKNDSAFTEFIAERVIETQKDMMRLLQIQMPKIEQSDTLEIEPPKLEM